MKKLIVIIFVLFIKLSLAQNPADKSVIYVPVHHQPGSEQMPLEYNPQTTRMVQVMEVPKAEKGVSVLVDSVQTTTLKTLDNTMLKVIVNPYSTIVRIVYKLETDVKATISIQDMHGITIESRTIKGQRDQLTFITKYWKPGVYVTSLKVNGRLVESTNFTILE